MNALKENLSDVVHLYTMQDSIWQDYKDMPFTPDSFMAIWNQYKSHLRLDMVGQSKTQEAQRGLYFCFSVLS